MRPVAGSHVETGNYNFDTARLQLTLIAQERTMDPQLSGVDIGWAQRDTVSASTLVEWRTVERRAMGGTSQRYLWRPARVYGSGARDRRIPQRGQIVQEAGR